VGHSGNRREGGGDESGMNFHGQIFQNVDKETRKSGAGA